MLDAVKAPLQSVCRAYLVVSDPVELHATTQRQAVLQVFDKVDVVVKDENGASYIEEA